MKLIIKTKPGPVNPLADVLPLDRMGMVLNEPNDVYHATKALSKSKLDDFLDKPRRYYQRHVTKTLEREESQALRIGAAAHPLILEGVEVFDDHYMIAPKIDKRTAKGKEEYAIFTAAAEAAKKTILTADEARTIRDCAAAVRRNPLAVAILERALCEVTFRTKTDQFYVQARPDAYCEASADLAKLLTDQGFPTNEGDLIVADLKTTSSRLKDWARTSFVQFGYHRSAPFYNSVVSDILRRPVKHYFFIVVEKDEPAECGVFWPDARSMKIGWEEVLNGMRHLAESYRTGEWYEFSSNIQSIGLPVWYAGAPAA